jgi:hypothetical protein
VKSKKSYRTMTTQRNDKTFSTVRWTGRKCIRPTNSPLVPPGNVDQELGWTTEEYKKIGVKYGFLRAHREKDWYPHYIRNRDNLIRLGGLFPLLHVHA